jgi:hypothetical protein
MGVIVLLIGVWSQERNKESSSEPVETELSPENSGDQVGGENLGE